VVGKAVGKDADAGKATLISLLGVDNARAELAAAHRDALAHLDIFGDKADTLRAAADFVVSRTH
jgi:farnesyl diphosphate synthase